MLFKLRAFRAARACASQARRAPTHRTPTTTTCFFMMIVYASRRCSTARALTSVRQSQAPSSVDVKAPLYARPPLFLRSRPQTLNSLEIPYINARFCMPKTVRFGVQNVWSPLCFLGQKVPFSTTYLGPKLIKCGSF